MERERARNNVKVDRQNKGVTIRNQAITIGTLTPPTTTILLIGRLFVEANAADGEKERRRSDSSMLT